MGLIGYGLRGLIRNRGRTFGIAIGVIIAITLISGTNIASDSMTSFEVQKSLDDTIIDLSVFSIMDDPDGITAILQGVQESYTEIEAIIPLAGCSVARDLIALNATGPIYWPDINASWFAQEYFEDVAIMAGFDYLSLNHPRLQGMLNITEGSFPNNNASIMIDEVTASRYNLTMGSNLSIGLLSIAPKYSGDCYITTNYTRDITNLTIAGVFSIKDYSKVRDFLSFYGLQYGHTVILTNFTTMRGLLDLFIPDVEDIFPWRFNSYNLIIDHAIVDVFNLGPGKSLLIDISNEIYQAGGLPYHFSTIDNLYNTILFEEGLVNNFRYLYFLVSIPALLIGLYLTSTLYNQNLERRIAEIGQLKSKGATTRQIATWFLLESGIMGLIGGAVGYLGGFVLSPLFLQVTLQGEFPQFLSMNLLHGSVISLVFSLILGAGSCVISVIKPVRHLNKLAVVDATKEFINFKSIQPWKSRLDIPVLILGIIPIVWMLLINDAIFQLLPSDIRPIFILISQGMSAAAVIAPFFLAYGIIKLVVGRSPPRFSKIAQGIASIVSRKSAWLIGRNVGGRPKQSGGLVFILAMTICLGIVTSTTKASQSLYENNLAYAQVGADLKIGLDRPDNRNYSFALKDVLPERYSPNIALITPAMRISMSARGASGSGSLTTSGYIIGLNATEYCDAVSFKPDFMSSGDPTLAFSELAKKPNGTLVMESWAKINGYRVGDPLFLELGIPDLTSPCGGTTWSPFSFEIIGFYLALPGFKEGSMLTIAANLDYLNTTIPGFGSINSYAYLLAKMGDQPMVNGSTLATYIREDFYQNVTAVTSFEDALANSGNTGFASIVKILDVAYLFLVIIATAGLSIILARSFSERRREIATLRARGMEFRDLLKLQGGEGTTLVILGACLGTVGLLMAYFLNYEIGLGLAAFATVPRLFVIPLSLLWQVILTFIVLIAVVWIISWREVKQTNIPEIADILRVY